MKRLFDSPVTWLTFVGTIAAATLLMAIVERLVNPWPQNKLQK